MKQLTHLKIAETMPFGMIPLTNHHSSDVTVRSLTVILVHPEGITVYIAIARFVPPLQHCLRTAQLGAAGGMYGKVSQRKEGNLHLGLSAVISCQNMLTSASLGVPGPMVQSPCHSLPNYRNLPCSANSASWIQMDPDGA